MSLEPTSYETAPEPESERRKQLVRNLVASSAADAKSRLLLSFFSALDEDGWLIEYSRAALRLRLGTALTHQTWAEFLSLGESRRYRLVTLRPDELRVSLLELARAAFKYSGEDALHKLVRSPEYLRWARSLGLHQAERERARGRKLGQIETASENGLRLEALRLDAGFKLKNWAHRIGTSENTYRKKLAEGDVPPLWLAAAVQIPSQRRVVAAQAAKVAVVTEAELTAAVTAVWEAYEASRKSLAADAPAPNPDDVAQITVETFEPSDEGDLE